MVLQLLDPSIFLISNNVITPIHPLTTATNTETLLFYTSILAAGIPNWILKSQTRNHKLLHYAQITPSLRTTALKSDYMAKTQSKLKAIFKAWFLTLVCLSVVGEATCSIQQPHLIAKLKLRKLQCQRKRYTSLILFTIV